MKRSLTACGLAIILLMVGVISAFATSTGRIAGRVVDKQSGETLIGVNIIVQGTTLGAASDADGDYFILQVPPGKHTLEVSYIGYHPMTITEVEVRSDLTTRVNIELEPAFIESPAITVVADDPLIRHDITSTRRVTTREEMQYTPGMDQALDMFRMQAGAVIDTGPQSLPLQDGVQLQVRDESLQNIHVRGGRGGEILFMVDGMPVTHPIYGGRSVLDLDINAVNQVELITGAFNAEFGQAQSGVVNITTRSGGTRLQGGIEYKSDALGGLGESYGTHYSSFNLGGPAAPFNWLSTRLGLPGKFRFFLSGNMNLTNTAYNNRRTRGTFNLFGLEIPERQDNSAGLSTKLDWDISNALRSSVSYHGSWKQWSNFNWLWLSHPDHTPLFARNNHNVSVDLRHTLSRSTFYSLRFGYMAVDYHASLDGARPTDFWAFFPDSADFAQNRGVSYHEWERNYAGRQPYRVRSQIAPPTFDPLTGFFDDTGYEAVWRDDRTNSFTIRGDITSQVHRDHLVKIGGDIQYHDLQYVDVADGGFKLSHYGRQKYGVTATEEIPRPPGPFPELGENRWVFHTRPLIGGFYAQDKFERETLIINAGIRLDLFHPGQTVFDEDWKRSWQAATGLDPDWPGLRYTVSPRFGISFPVSVNTVLFFSYGHFSQLPELQFYYRDPYSGGFTGNPHLDYEQTILYEFGFTRRLAHDWAVDVKSYAKDVSRQIGTTQLQAALGLPVSLYDNRGYARARGIEVEVTKRYSNFTSGNVTYTVQWADGYSSSAFDDYVRSQTAMPHPIRERRLGWDVRHQIVLQGSIISVPGQHLNLFGLRLPDHWNVTVLSRISSGHPFTPGTNDQRLLQVLENTASGPPTYQTDIKFNKSLAVFGNSNLSLFVDVFNVFDQRNVQLGYGFNVWTGNPFIFGDTFQDQPRGLDWFEMFRLRDPRQFSTGRHARFGLAVGF